MLPRLVQPVVGIVTQSDSILTRIRAPLAATAVQVLYEEGAQSRCTQLASITRFIAIQLHDVSVRRMCRIIISAYRQLQQVAHVISMSLVHHQMQQAFHMVLFLWSEAIVIHGGLFPKPLHDMKLVLEDGDWGIDTRDTFMSDKSVDYPALDALLLWIFVLKELMKL